MPNRLTRKTFSPGAQIFREGEPGEQAYIIVRGEVEISALQRGRKIVIARLCKDELFGEMALIDDKLRSATATTMDETEVIVVERALLRDKIDDADPLLKILLKVTLQRFRWTQQLVLRSSGGGDGDTTLQEQAVKRIELEEDLTRAIAEKQFMLYYQPIIILRGGHVAGFEALLRWEHPERGLILPVDFIGFAEETGLIVPMGRWVLKQALADHKKLQAAHKKIFPNQPPIFMSINVSGRQLLELNEIDELLRIIEEAGVQNRDIKLEITESLMVDDPDHAAIAFRKLKDEGVRLAIDDFGTGYSSLSYLNRFPLDTLKIDRSFVANMLRDKASLDIVRGIAGLAGDLGMDIIAEGIESTEEITQLRDFGCSYGQGFLMSRPVPIGEAVQLLKSRLSW
ncbi:MAG: EAL domain-containing protein [Proteobacteria bacterium]|nr:EAL domain-containing protein [Pseudomonadota bacterium]